MNDPAATRPGLHPATVDVLRFFEHAHLSGPLAQISSEFHTLAYRLVSRGDLQGPQLTNALTKLLEAKDCAVRAAIPASTEGQPQ